MSNCKYCNTEIEWEDKVPFNTDGSRHSCKKKPRSAEPRDCKYECQTTLLWNDDKEAFEEINTGILHTKERCQEAKAKLQAKNDHGNEFIEHATTFPPKSQTTRDADYTKFVDHTIKPELKLKILTDPTPEGLTHQYNNFPHSIKFSQYQAQGSQYTIAVYYEETK
jgi:hypothetical protein